MMPLAIPFPILDPVLIEIGPFAIRWYALAYIGGLLIGWWLAKRLMASDSLWAKSPGNPALLDDLLVWIAIGVILGGRLAYVIFYNPVYYLDHPLEALAVWHGGMSFHGGIAGAALAIAVFARRNSVPVLSLFDVACAVAPIGLFLGRIANFVNAELYGRVTDVAWGVIFPNGGPLPRHPSQLYEAALEGLLLFILVMVAVRLGALKRPGFVAGLFGTGYGIARIFVEFFREPDAQIGYLFGFVTMGMLLTLPLLLVGLTLLFRARQSP